jgi:hypothetical protein
MKPNKLMMSTSTISPLINFLEYSNVSIKVSVFHMVWKIATSYIVAWLFTLVQGMQQLVDTTMT